MSDDSSLVEVGRYFDNTQTHIMRGILETHDIPCFIFDEHHTTTAWHMNLAIGGSRLMVLSEDKEAALELLQEPSFEKEDLKNDTNKTPVVQKPKTPYLKNIVSIFATLFSGVPFIFPKSKKKK